MDINEWDINCYTPLHYSAIHGHKGTLNTIISLGGKVDRIGRRGRRAVEVGLEEKQAEIVEELLVGKGASHEGIVVVDDGDEFNTLHLAVAKGMLNIAKYLIDSKGNSRNSQSLLF